MLQSLQLIVVERDEPLLAATTSVTRAGSVWTPAVTVPADFWGRYRGVDGTPWPSETEPFGIELDTRHGTASLSQVGQVQAYRDAVATEFVVAFVAFAVREDVLVPGWRCIGFDVGFVGYELGCFSALVHEGVLGTADTLRRLAKGVTPDYLLPTREAASRFAEERRRLALEGYDLEDCEVSPEPIAIYLQSV